VRRSGNLAEIVDIYVRYYFARVRAFLDVVQISAAFRRRIKMDCRYTMAVCEEENNKIMFSSGKK